MFATYGIIWASKRVDLSKTQKEEKPYQRMLAGDNKICHNRTALRQLMQHLYVDADYQWEKKVSKLCNYCQINQYFFNNLFFNSLYIPMKNYIQQIIFSN